MNKQLNKMQLPQSTGRAALARCLTQLKRWQMEMPPSDPLLMDFGQGNFYQTGLIEYWIANEIEFGYCGKYLFLFDKQQCPFHSHRQKHETFFVVKGTICMIVNKQEQLMNAGEVLTMPPGDIHSFYGLGNALIMEVSTPCLVDDNYFQDQQIAQWLLDTQ